MRVSLILGGARSGKSARALELAAGGPRVFVATAEAGDAEMAGRIARHRAEREAGWRTVEAPLDIAPVLAAHREGAMIVDCLTLWLSNLIHAGRDPAAETAALVAALGAARAADPGGEDRINERRAPSADIAAHPPAGYPPRIVLVSNEVGLSISPANALARRFRDEQGRLNQRVAAVADHVEFIAAGLPLTLKGAP